MYLVYLGGEFLHDPYQDDRRIYDGKLSGDCNDYLTLEFTVPPTHPLRGSFKERDYARPVEAYFDDQLLFRGYVEETQETMRNELKVSCKGDLAMLDDVVVRPYKTDPDADVAGAEYIGGSGFAYYFRWLIDQYNARCLYTGADGSQRGSEKRFEVRYPPGSGTSLDQEGAKLDDRGNSYRSSTSKPTTLSEIKDKILESPGAYLQLWYDGGDRCLALYADVPAALENDQVIEFGTNMTGYSFDTSCLDTYTAVRAEGKSDSEGNIVTLSQIPDGPVSGGFRKQGDVVYSPEAAERYGYREYAFQNTDAGDAQTLLANSIVQLQTMMAPAQTISVKALDMVFVGEGYRHLLPGQKALTQSAVNNLSLSLLVSSCDINFSDPSNTSYEMGSPSTRITKTYGSIIKDIDEARQEAQAAQGSASQAGQQAQNAQQAAEGAQKAAEDAVAVEVVEQGTQAGSGIALMDAADGSEKTVITPAEGVTVEYASMARTGSIVQVYAKLTLADPFKTGDTIGSVPYHPISTTYANGLLGHIEPDGKIVLTASHDIGSIEICSTYVKR